MSILMPDETDTNYYRVLLTMISMEVRCGRGAPMAREDVIVVANYQWPGTFCMKGYEDLIDSNKVDPRIQKLIEMGLVDRPSQSMLRVTQAGVYQAMRLNKAGIKTPAHPSAAVNDEHLTPDSRKSAIRQRVLERLERAERARQGF